LACLTLGQVAGLTSSSPRARFSWAVLSQTAFCHRSGRRTNAHCLFLICTKNNNNNKKKTFAMLESGTHYRRFMEKDDPKNGGEFRQRFGVGSTRPMFKSTDERKRPFYLYVNHISPLTLVETLLITLL
jgi:hypothetical protein